GGAGPPGGIVHGLGDPGVIWRRAGRPVLVVTGVVASPQLNRVVVAWKDTRECRRGARCASVFAVDERSSARRNRRRATGNRQITSVRRRGLSSPPRRGRGARGVSASSRSGRRRAFSPRSRRGRDLIVAGGYGHSRLGEWIFGGVTHELLASSPVCCLLSH